MSASTRVFVARLTGLSVFDPLGDQVGRVRDVVVMFSVNRPEPRVIGLVVEVPGRRRVFVPMTRVTSIDAGAVITTGLVNMRRFEQRTNEVLVAAELFDRTVRVTTPEAVEAGFADSLVEDLAIEQGPRRDWLGTRSSSGRPRPASRPRRRRCRASPGAARARRCSSTSATSSACTSRPAPRAPSASLRPTTTSRWPTSPRSSTTSTRSAARRWLRPSTTSASPTCSRSCPRTTRSRSSPACARARRRRPRGHGA